MPLRDHFRTPVDRIMPWEGFHSGWPMTIVQHLRPLLPDGFRAEPGVHIGRHVEGDVLGFVTENWGADPDADLTGDSGGGLATLVETEPTVEVETDLDDFDTFEVRVYDTHHARRLVAAIELISPSNKDRPESRRTFVAKCASLLEAGVSVCVVDIVTSRQFNLYAELFQFIGQQVPAVAGQPDQLYAVEIRPVSRAGRRLRLQVWAKVLTVGQRLPALPLWLGDEQRIAFDLEIGYESACETFDLPPP